METGKTLIFLFGLFVCNWKKDKTGVKKTEIKVFIQIDAISTNTLCVCVVNLEQKTSI